MVLAIGEPNEIHRCGLTDTPIVTAVVNEEIQFPAECSLEEVDIEEKKEEAKHGD